MPEAYDALAPFYEQNWGSQFFSNAKGLFSKLMIRRLGSKARVLDLCCGTGEFAAWLGQKGIAATGLDSSSRMVGRARINAPGAEFIRADMCAFTLPQRFDAVTCFYNSINHALTAHSLQGVLQSVNESLNPSGWFLFDGIDEQGYLESWHADEVVRNFDQVCAIRYRYDRDQKLAICNITITGPEPERQFEVRQRPYCRTELSEALVAAGFSVELVHPIHDSYPLQGRYAILARTKGNTEVSRPQITVPPGVRSISANRT